jgi:hypothetical protein
MRSGFHQIFGTRGRIKLHRAVESEKERLGYARQMRSIGQINNPKSRALATFSSEVNRLRLQVGEDALNGFAEFAFFMSTLPPSVGVAALTRKRIVTSIG